MNGAETGEERAGVSRAARVLDLAGLTILLIGVAIYGWAWLGMREIIGIELSPELRPPTAIARMDALSELSRVGIWIMAAGGAVLLAGTAFAWWQRRRRTAP